MAKKELKKIELSTLPNGYSLEIDNKGFMYFTLEKLLEGFFVHVGLEILSFIDKESIHDLIIACATYPNEGDAIKAVAKMEPEIEALKNARQRDIETIRDLKSRNAKLAEQLAITKEKLLGKPKSKKKKQPKSSHYVVRADVEPKKKVDIDALKKKLQASGDIL
jgi:hypothetical protein